jgi:predicted dehydrogenase/dTDP-4-amino-4,6-dideoxygalactose transaminase
VTSTLINKPAILGGQPLGPETQPWPLYSPESVQLTAESLSSGQTCVYAGNPARLSTELEEALAAAAGFKYAIPVANGTVAIAVAVAGMLVYRGQSWWEGRDLVVGPAFTWASGTYGGAKAGVDMVTRGMWTKIELIDANGVDWTIDVDALLECIEEKHERIAAVVVPSLLSSHPEGLQRVLALCEQYNLPFVHDGAQCGGAELPGPLRPETATLSLQGGKLQGSMSGEGGCVFANNASLATIMRQLADCGNPCGGALDPLQGEHITLQDGSTMDPRDLDERFPLTGNFRLAGPVAAAALGSVRQVAEKLDVLRAVRRRLPVELRVGDLVVFRGSPVQEGDTPTYGFNLMLTEEAERELGLTADNWREIFAAERLAWDATGYKYGVRRPYMTAHKYKPMARDLASPGKEFPNADAISRRGLMFHLAHLLDEATPERLVAIVERAVANAQALRKHFGVRTVAVFGCGNIARIAWGPNLRRKGVQLLAYDVNPDAARAFAAEFGATVCDSPDEVWAQQPDGVVIATSPPFHAGLAMQAIVAGVKHLMVEKPLTTNLPDGRRLVEAARRNGVTLSQSFHQLIMLEEVLDGVGRESLTTFDYRWSRRDKAAADLLEDLGPHAFAMLLDVLPYDRIKSVAVDDSDGNYRVVLACGNANLSVRLESGVQMPVRERVCLTVADESGKYEAEMRTTQTPSDEELDYRPTFERYGAAAIERLARVLPVDEVRTQMVERWVDVLGGRSQRFADSKALQVQALLEVAKASARCLGARVDTIPSSKLEDSSVA